MPKYADWNEVYKRTGQLQYSPDAEVDRAVSLFREHGVKKLLDLGCGTGRHAARFAREGFKVTGLDISEVAGNIFREVEAGADVLFATGDMCNIPFPDDYFDGVFCFIVIHHARAADVRRAVAEVARVLKRGGIFFATFPSLRNVEEHGKEFADAEEIEPDTYVGLDYLDGDVPHHFFSEAEMEKILSPRFDIIDRRQGDVDLEHEKTRWNYYIVGAKKR